MPENNSSRKVLRLPREPRELRDDHVEHLGAAILASGGLFVEKHINEKVARREVTEIDAFGTAWKHGQPHHVLVEAKSGKWDNRDLFALLGKKLYLDADLALMLHTVEQISEERRALLTRLEDKGHSVMAMNSDDASTPEFVANLCKEEEGLVHERMTAIYSLQAWRYAFWTERALLDHLTHEAKSLGNVVPSLRTARELLETLNNCFFLSDCRDQARHLYDFYFEHPRLTARMIEERKRAAPTAELKGRSPENAFSACVYDGKIPGVQACMYLEHRARCLLVKIAVDTVMRSGKPRQGFTIKDALVPHSFRTFADQVATVPERERLPQLWQAYIFGWGGFIVTSRAEQEYEHLGLEAGLPPERVGAGLEVFDKLFPLDDGGWHYDQDGATGMTLLKMVPNVFRGLGVQRRRWIYGDTGLFDELPRLGRRDCEKWAKCGYELLSAKTKT